MSSFPCAAVHGDFFLAVFETLVSRTPPQEFWCFPLLQMSQFIPFPLSVRATTKLDCMFSQSGSMWILYNEDIFNNAISVMLIVRLSALTCNDSPSKNITWLSDFPMSESPALEIAPTGGQEQLRELSLEFPSTPLD